ncbi:hypothetical protein CEXT_807351 [Caerostris extrusa]|uniref:Uncharacterized protein n=1 Tax=Caerostris extrusa TaxID=172846 RepID=A0AAV4XID9_CAEEX|nr:hypothetical protein CEXT_807351 [Caerostris extrusa]
MRFDSQHQVDNYLPSHFSRNRSFGISAYVSAGRSQLGASPMVSVPFGPDGIQFTKAIFIIRTKPPTCIC